MTLTEFLLARIAEDEAQALELIRRQRHKRTVRDAELGYIRAFDPKRVADDCEAKRLIVELSEHGCGDDYQRVQQALALPYADHPDYRRVWKP